MRYNPATEYDSLVKLTDDLAETNVNTFPLTKKARAFNVALDRAYTIFAQNVDTKGYDDKNFTTLPQGTYDITAGERNISVDTDDEDAEILKIYFVMAKNAEGNWYRLEKTDIRNRDSWELAEGDETGEISQYDWVGKSLVFDVTPEATIAGGIKVFYMRNSSYFTESDTDKEPGLPTIFQPYLAYYTAWQYSMSKGLGKKNDLAQMVVNYEKDIAEFASSQSIETNKRLTPYTVNAE